MLPDRVLNPGPLTYESGALPIALRGPAGIRKKARKENGIRNEVKGISEKNTLWLYGKLGFV